MKTIIVNYNGSGAKTLRIAGYLLLAIGAIATIVLLESIVNFYTFIIAFIPTIVGMTFFGICTGLAKLVELSLIAKEQRTALLEKEGIQLEFTTYKPVQVVKQENAVSTEQKNDSQA